MHRALDRPGGRRARLASAIGPTTMGRLRWLARGWSLVALVLFAALAFVVGVPQGPEGTLISGPLQTQIQLVLLGVTAVGVLVAWRWETLGGAVMVLAAAGMGVFAAFEYRPEAAVLPFLAFLLPGLVFLLGGLRPRPWPWAAIAAGLLGAVVVASGVAAQEVYDRAFGPAHPQSALAERPVDRVEWAWSGALTPTGAVVTAGLDEPGDARLVVSPVGDLSQRRRTFEPALLVEDGEVLRFDLTGLRPRTPYFYAVEVDGRLDRTRIGRLRTPARGADSFTLALGGCARTDSNGAVFDAIRGLDPLMYLMLGDVHYADIGGNDPGRFRAELDRMLTRPAQQALYLSTPVAYVWDDHDFGADDADGTSASRPAAQAVYREYVPHYPLPAGAREGPIYQAFTLGRVRVILTDGRSERTPASATDDATKTMLGHAQKAWLKRELLAARDRYPLTLLVTSVPWIGPDGDGAEGWGEYATERRELSRFIADNSIENVVMLAGDAHMVAFDDGSNSDYSGTGRAAVPVLHGAALDRPGKVKGGPYSHGAYPGAGQFGTVAVRDDGQAMDVTLRGLDWTGRVVVEQRLRLPSP